MATILASKAPTEAVRRVWTVPVDRDDGPLSASLSASGVTVASNSFEGDDLVLNLTGGTSGTTGSITVTITTSRGRTLVETLYIPVIVSTSAAETVNDICSFALRKVEGLGSVPEASGLDDAIERLTDMLRLWRASGADVGAPDLLDGATVIYCPNSYLSAIKNNLIIELADLYGFDPNGRVIQTARSGLAHIKAANLPDDRPQAGYL